MHTGRVAPDRSCQRPAERGVVGWAVPRHLLRLRAGHCSGSGPLSTVRMGIDLRRVRPVADLMSYAREHGFAITFDGGMGPPSSAEVEELG